MSLVESIAQSYRDIGTAQAGGTRDRGQIYGSLIAGLGQVPGQIAEAQQRQKLAQQEAQIRDQQLQEGQFKLEDAKRQQAAQAALGAAMSKALNPDGSFNEDLLRQSVVSDPKTAAAWPEIQKGLMASKEASLKVRKLQDDHDEAEAAHMSAIAHAADAADTPDAKATTLLIAVAGGVKDGSISQAHASPFISQMLGEDGQPDPAKVPGVIAQMKQLSAAELEKRGQAAAAMRGPQPNASTLALAAAGGDPAEALRLSKMSVESPEQAAERQAALERQAAAQAETARHNKVSEGLSAQRIKAQQASQTATGALTQEGVDYAATQFRVTGVMPPMGMGNSQARAAIINKAAEQAKVLGQSPVASIQKQAAYKGDAAALKKMQSMSAASEAFESKALAQEDIIRDLSSKVPRTSWPIINSALQAGRTSITGDENATKLANAIDTFTAEYAKIMSGATGSAAASSDSARAAAARLINTSMGKGTMAGVLDLMKKEMDLTLGGYTTAIDHITTRMGGAPPEPAATPTTQPSGRYNPATGKVEPIK